MAEDIFKLFITNDSCQLKALAELALLLLLRPKIEQQSYATKMSPSSCLSKSKLKEKKLSC